MFRGENTITTGLSLPAAKTFKRYSVGDDECVQCNVNKLLFKSLICEISFYNMQEKNLNCKYLTFILSKILIEK
jgi:hypothetical protein